MASRGRPSFALATDSYVTVEYPLYLSQLSLTELSLVPKPPLPYDAASTGWSQICSGNRSSFLRSVLTGLVGEWSLAYGLNPASRLLSTTPCGFPTRSIPYTSIPERPSLKNYKHAIRNGLSTTLPLVAHNIRPTITSCDCSVLSARR